MRPTKLGLTLLATSLLCSGCSSILDKLDHINKPPPMTEVVNPQEKPEYKEMTWPMPENPPPSKQYANSLWQPGARTFFRDGRASRVGDILKVKVRINDKMQFNNQTQAKRDFSDQTGAPEILGQDLPPGGFDAEHQAVQDGRGRRAQKPFKFPPHRPAKTHGPTPRTGPFIIFLERPSARRRNED